MANWPYLKEDLFSGDKVAGPRHAVLPPWPKITQWVTSFKSDAVGLALILTLLYLVCGTLMESVSMMLATLPILAPALRATGVIMVVLVEATLISPPEGIHLYVI